MFNLPHFPLEIWTLILQMRLHEAGCFDQRNMAKNAQTCKLFHQIINPELYRSVSLDNLPLRLFLRSVLENPDLARQVKEVTFEWDIEDGDEDEIVDGDEDGDSYSITSDIPPETLDPCVQAAQQYGWPEPELELLRQDCPDAKSTLLLEILPNVTGVLLDFPPRSYIRDNEWTNECGIQKFALLRSYFNRCSIPRPNDSVNILRSQPCMLEHLSVANPYPEPQEYCVSGPNALFWESDLLEGVIFMPNLRRLSLTKCESRGMDVDQKSRLDKLAGTSALEHVSIQNAALSACEIDVLLTIPRALKTLKYHVASVHELWDEDLVDEYWVSPAILLQRLENQAESLESLDILSIQSSSSWIGNTQHWDWEESAFDFNEPWAKFRSPYNAHQLRDFARTMKEDPGYELEQLHGDQREMFLILQPETQDRLAQFWRPLKAKLIQPIDLHAFAVLKVVACHASDLLGPMVRADPTSYRRLSNYLPSCLETLKLTYTDYFDDHEPQWRVKDDEFEVEPDWYHAYYSHIEQLMHDKPKRLPSFRRFEMYLASGWPSPNDGVRNAAVSADVHPVIMRKRRGSVEWFVEE